MYKNGKCVVCGLTSNYIFGQFDHNGSCKTCRDFRHENKEFKGVSALIREVDLGEDDKMGVTVSGGKDSIYLWAKMVEIFGNDHVTAFCYYRPGITHPLAMENVKNTGRILNAPFYVYTDETAYERLRTNFRILLDNPQPALVRVALCSGCRYGITKTLLLKEYPELDFDNNLEVLRRDQKFKYKNNDTKDNNFSIDYEYQLFDYDNYCENNPEEIEKYVVEHFNWKKSDRSWHFDCKIEDFKDVFYYGMLGYTECDFKYSAMVRYGLLSREESIRLTEEHHRSIRDGFTGLAAKLEDLGFKELVPLLKNFYDSSVFLSLKPSVYSKLAKKYACRL